MNFGLMKINKNSLNLIPLKMKNLGEKCMMRIVC